MKIGFLGPSQSFSHAAAKQIFPDEELLAQRTIPEVFEKLEKGFIDKAVVPIENSSGGSVSQTLDELILRDVSIVGEHFLEIKQCFLSNKPLSEAKQIYSHQQGFLQCRNWVQKNIPHAELIEVSSTSLAAKMAAENNSAAIASDSAAKEFGIKILADNISDWKFNKTRFVVISVGKSGAKVDGKISLIFSIKNEPCRTFSTR